MAETLPRAAPEFLKMHGLGNDFLVLDARRAPLALDAARTRAMADRRTGVGFDQLLIIEPPRAAGAYAFVRIRNSDGDEVEACGNGARCVASLLMAEVGRDRVVIDSLAGPLEAERRPGGLVAIDLGPARLDWRQIPLAREMDTLHLDFRQGPLADPAAVNVGNPHAIFFVPDAEAVDLAGLGPKIEHDPLFPERINVEAVTPLADGRLRMRVWERGAGITRACGTGAAASLVAAHRRGLAPRKGSVLLDGGTLEVEWRADNHVILTGPVAVSFSGRLDGAMIG
jgi:diaminopimelate epimerase